MTEKKVEKSAVVKRFESMEELSRSASERLLGIKSVINEYNQEMGIDMMPEHVSTMAKDFLILGTIEVLLRNEEGEKNGKKRTSKK